MKQTEQLHRDLQQQMIEFFERRSELYGQAEEQAAKVIDKARAEAEEVMRDLRKMRFESGAHVKEHELIDARRRLDAAVPNLDKGETKLTGSPAKT